jgi:hypothetical protein
MGTSGGDRVRTDVLWSAGACSRFRRCVQSGSKLPHSKAGSALVPMVLRGNEGDRAGLRAIPARSSGTAAQKIDSRLRSASCFEVTTSMGSRRGPSTQKDRKSAQVDFGIPGSDTPIQAISIRLAVRRETSNWDDRASPNIPINRILQQIALPEKASRSHLELPMSRGEVSMVRHE